VAQFRSFSFRHLHHKPAKRTHTAAHRQRGGALLEFAIVIPVFVLFLVGIAEIGRAVMVQQTLTDVSHGACRLAILESKTYNDVQTYVEATMSAAGLAKYKLVVDPTPPSNADSFDPVTVVVQMDYSDIALGLIPGFVRPNTLQGVTIMPRE